MFDQVRVDCGKEFYLSLGVQEMYRQLRNDQTKSPYRQTQSKKVFFMYIFRSKVSFIQFSITQQHKIAQNINNKTQKSGLTNGFLTLITAVYFVYELDNPLS